MENFSHYGYLVRKKEIFLRKRQLNYKKRAISAEKMYDIL